MQEEYVEWNAIQRLTKDLKDAAVTLSDTEARFLVDAYYIMQDQRIRTDGQIRSMGEEPHVVLGWFTTQSRGLENQVRRALDAYSDSDPVGRWMRGIVGIGPVIAAGLLAHIDIHKAPTVGHIWRFAGLDPTSTWEKGQKRPYNAALKVLCWKAGESFIKTQGHPEAVYGPLYAERKAMEIERNERGDFADQAAAILEKKKIGKTTDAFKAYSAGKLPPAHIHARARRFAVKLFLSHLHEVWFEHEFGREPPIPYIIAHGDHGHRIPVPNKP